MGSFWLALVIATWFIPATVISTTGFRREFRWTQWDQVASVFPAGPGDPDVLVGLRDNRKVSLSGVPQDRRAGILVLVEMAARSGEREGWSS